jgi:ankyrin repeat protein
MLAAYFGYNEIVKILLNNGADPDLAFEDKDLGEGVVTAYSAATKGGHPETASLLKEFNAHKCKPINYFQLPVCSILRKFK